MSKEEFLKLSDDEKWVKYEELQADLYSIIPIDFTLEDLVDSVQKFCPKKINKSQRYVIQSKYTYFKHFNFMWSDGKPVVLEDAALWICKSQKWF